MAPRKKPIKAPTKEEASAVAEAFANARPSAPRGIPAGLQVNIPSEFKGRIKKFMGERQDLLATLGLALAQFEQQRGAVLQEIAARDQRIRGEIQDVLKALKLDPNTPVNLDPATFQLTVVGQPPAPAATTKTRK